MNEQLLCVLSKAPWNRFDPARPSAIEEAQSLLGPREAAGNKQCCGFFKTFEEEQLPSRGGREGGEGGWMTEWQLLRRGSSHLLKGDSTFSATEPRCAHACPSSPRRRARRLTHASLGRLCFYVLDETSLRARPCPLRATRFCHNKANKARSAFLQN